MEVEKTFKVFFGVRIYIPRGKEASVRTRFGPKTT